MSVGSSMEWFYGCCHIHRGTCMYWITVCFPKELLVSPVLSIYYKSISHPVWHPKSSFHLLEMSACVQWGQARSDYGSFSVFARNSWIEGQAIWSPAQCGPFEGRRDRCLHPCKSFFIKVLSSRLSNVSSFIRLFSLDPSSEQSSSPNWDTENSQVIFALLHCHPWETSSRGLDQLESAAIQSKCISALWIGNKLSSCIISFMYNMTNSFQTRIHKFHLPA